MIPPPGQALWMVAKPWEAQFFVSAPPFSGLFFTRPTKETMVETMVSWYFAGESNQKPGLRGAGFRPTRAVVREILEAMRSVSAGTPLGAPPSASTAELMKPP